ncbi:MAG: WD40/YVTN/BNR-like repeat-containing protein [Thermoplasmata archaeon]
MGKNGSIRVLVGTRKGGYIVDSDATRRRWKVRGPTQPGKDVFHMVADPREPDRMYSLANSPFFGPILYRSRDAGRKWEEVGTPLMAPSPKRSNDPAQMGQHPLTNLWHLEPGPPGEPESLFLGVDPAGLYRSDDRGRSWAPMPGLNEHPTRPKWNPGAGGMCLHTILIDRADPRRMYVGISAAGVFRSDDGGERWRPMNRGVRVSFQPEKLPEVGQCVHRIVQDPGRPETIYRQDHDGIYISRDAAESWQRIGRPLPHDFGFVAAAPEARPGEAYFVPLRPDARVCAEGSLEVWRWTERGRAWKPTVRGRLGPGDFGTHREALAVDREDPFGIYLGTTTGDLAYSVDGARSWSTVPYRFPSIHSVSAGRPG